MRFTRKHKYARAQPLPDGFARANGGKAKHSKRDKKGKRTMMIKKSSVIFVFIFLLLFLSRPAHAEQLKVMPLQIDQGFQKYYEDIEKAKDEDYRISYYITGRSDLNVVDGERVSDVLGYYMLNLQVMEGKEGAYEVINEIAFIFPRDRWPQRGPQEKVEVTMKFAIKPSDAEKILEEMNNPQAASGLGGALYEAISKKMGEFGVDVSPNLAEALREVTAHFAAGSLKANTEWIPGIIRGFPEAAGKVREELRRAETSVKP